MLRSLGQNSSGDHEQTTALDCQKHRQSLKLLQTTQTSSSRQHPVWPDTKHVPQVNSNVQTKSPSRAFILVHSPNNILTVMSSANMAEVFLHCLAVMMTNRYSRGWNWLIAHCNTGIVIAWQNWRSLPNRPASTTTILSLDCFIMFNKYSCPHIKILKTSKICICQN